MGVGVSVGVRVAKSEPKNAAAVAATAAAAAAAAVEGGDDDDDDDEHYDKEKELAAKHTGCIEQEVPSHLPCTHRHVCMYGFTMCTHNTSAIRWGCRHHRQGRGV